MNHQSRAGHNENLKPPGYVLNKYQLITKSGVVERFAPYAHEVTNSVGNATVNDPSCDWEGYYFSMSERNKLVIYELPVESINSNDQNRPGQFIPITARLEHLEKAGGMPMRTTRLTSNTGFRCWGRRGGRWSWSALSALGHSGSVPERQIGRDRLSFKSHGSLVKENQCSGKDLEGPDGEESRVICGQIHDDLRTYAVRPNSVRQACDRGTSTKQRK